MPEYVCSRCFKPNGLSRTVRIAGWESGHPVRDPDRPDELIFETDGERDADWHDLEVEGFHCNGCGLETARLEQAVTTRPVAECRTCGFRGKPEDHPDTCSEEAEYLDPPEVAKEQEPLTPIPSSPGARSTPARPKPRLGTGSSKRSPWWKRIFTKGRRGRR